jgi:PAS domain S-box-containing protein
MMNRLATRNRGTLLPKKSVSTCPPPESDKDARLAELEIQNTRLHSQLEQLRKDDENHQASARRLESLYQQVPIAYVTLDEKGAITDWNMAAAALLEAKNGNLREMPLVSFVARKNVAILQDHVLRCKRVGSEQIVSELRLRGPQGPKPVQIRSVPFYSAGQRLFQTALIDLTEREQNERAMEKAREFSDTIIQTIHEPLVVLDLELKILRTNEAFARLFAISQHLARGRTFESVLNLWWAGNDLRSRLDQCLGKNISLTNFEFAVQPRNLGPRTFVFNARRLDREEDSPVLLVALEDVTARREAEERLADSNRQLQQLNNELEKRVDERTTELRGSNRQLEAFCYSIAHDLRGPLRASAGFGTILQDRFAEKLGPRGVEYVGRIIAASKQMDALIRDLLEYGRFNTVEFSPTPVDAEESLNWVISNLEPAIQEKRATIERKGRLPQVLGHKVALEAAFSNLISNALKFVPPQTTPEVTIWPEKRGRNVTISIADKGIGIPRQYHDRIFDVFQRLHTQKDYPGTGIGLAIVSKAIQRIGGKVGVDSEPGKGSRFWMTLPLAVPVS